MTNWYKSNLYQFLGTFEEQDLLKAAHLLGIMAIRLLEMVQDSLDNFEQN